MQLRHNRLHAPTPESVVAGAVMNWIVGFFLGYLAGQAAVLVALYIVERNSEEGCEWCG